jgi:hypothetical protein
MLFHAFDQRVDTPQIWIPPAPPRIIGVADHISESRRFAAQFTLRHRHSLLCFKLA